MGFLGRWKLVLFAAVAKLGIWGIGAVALVDASTIPVPMDLILAGYVWHDRGHFYIYCLLAAAGSAVGGLLPYALGRAGGELFLLNRINRQRFEQLRDRFSRQEFLAMLIPSMLPPPTPWKAFVFAAGVFEMKIPSFLLAVFIGRMIRWLLLSLLVIKLGPEVVAVVAHHALIAAAGLAVLVLIVLAWWSIKKKPAGETSQPPISPPQ